MLLMFNFFKAKSKYTDAQGNIFFASPFLEGKVLVPTAKILHARKCLGSYAGKEKREKEGRGMIYCPNTWNVRRRGRKKKKKRRRRRRRGSFPARK